MQYTITNPKTNETVECRTDNDAAAATVRGMATNDFAQSLARAYYSDRGCTHVQMFWIHKLANEQTAPAAPVAPPATYPNVVEFVARGGQRGSITFNTPCGNVVELKTAGPNSRYPGQLWVTNGAGYGAANGKFYGRVDFAGVFHPGRDATGPVVEFLRAAFAGLNDDPAAFAAAYGKQTGFCCFCHKFIETVESMAVGYGPVCAKRYGLPWGKKAMRCAKAKQQPVLA